MTILDMIAEKLHLKSPATKEESAKSNEAAANTGPALDNSKITVVFVLGGPGAGTGLQLTRLRVRGSCPVYRQGYTVRETCSGVWFLPSVRYADGEDPVSNPADLPRAFQRAIFSALNRIAKDPSMAL